MLTRELRLHNSSLLFFFGLTSVHIMVLHCMSETCCRCACRQPHVTQLFLPLLLLASSFSKETVFYSMLVLDVVLGCLLSSSRLHLCFLHFPLPFSTRFCCHISCIESTPSHLLAPVLPSGCFSPWGALTRVTGFTTRDSLRRASFVVFRDGCLQLDSLPCPVSSINKHFYFSSLCFPPLR